jgi:hypothetical protein
MNEHNEPQRIIFNPMKLLLINEVVLSLYVGMRSSLPDMFVFRGPVVYNTTTPRNF